MTFVLLVALGGDCIATFGGITSVRLNGVELATVLIEPFCCVNPVNVTHHMPGVAELFSVRLSQTLPAVRGVKFISLTVWPLLLFQRNVTFFYAPCIVVVLSHLKTAEMFTFSDWLYCGTEPVLFSELFKSKSWRNVKFAML